MSIYISALMTLAFDSFSEILFLKSKIIYVPLQLYPLQNKQDALNLTGDE